MSDRFSYRFPFAKYPAVRIAILLSTGIIAGRYAPIRFSLLVSIFGICCFVLICSEIRFHFTSNPAFYRLSTACYMAVLILFGMEWYQMRDKISTENHKNIMQAFVWEQAEFKGMIYNIRQAGSGGLQIDITADSTVIVDSLAWPEVYNLRALLDSAYVSQNMPANLKLGSRVHFLATVYPLNEKRNPFQFDYREYLHKRDIFIQASIDSIISVMPSDKYFTWAGFRQRVLDLIEMNFTPATRSLAKALLIGFKNELGREDRMAFSRVGLSHIMAVSGLHVGFVIAPLWLLIPWFWTLKHGKQVGMLFLVIILIGYAGLTGFSASVSRAALTGGLITYGRLFHKVRDSLNLTAVAAVILLLINPKELFEVGFQLSFSAVYVILLTMPVLTRLLPARIRFRWYGKLMMIVLVSLVVQVGLFPLLAFHFGEFSLVGPIANAVVVPFLGIVVPYALILLLVSAMVPKIGIIMNLPNDWFLKELDFFVRYSSELEWSWVRVHLESPVIFFIWIAGILLIASLIIPAFRWKMFGLLLALLIVDAGTRLIDTLRPASLSVTILDVGQGDAALIKTPGGKHFLIDTGRWTPGYNSARYIIIPHLMAEGTDRLDAVFLTHPHADHIGGITELINRIPIDTIYNSGYEYSSKLYRTYRKLAKQKSVPVRKLTAGRQIYIDPAIKIFVYGPQEAVFGEDPNERSLILELVYGNTEFLFVGDAGKIQEKRLIKNYEDLLNTDLLKVGHHGSRTSSSEDFLNLVTPKIAVVSLAKNNRFRHPHPEAIARLRNRSGKIYFTSLDKALIFTSNGRNIRRIKW